MKKVLLFSVAVLLVVTVSALAGSKGEHKAFKGTLSCLGCDLKKSEGALSQCKIYGHKHAIRLEDGKYISFLENDKSADLIKGDKWHGQDVEVHGTYYKDANVIDVDSFKFGDKSYGWCEAHGAMDMCSTGGHKMHGSEKGE